MGSSGGETSFFLETIASNEVDTWHLHINKTCITELQPFVWPVQTMAMNTPQVTKAELPQVLTVLLVRLKMNKLKWALLVCCLHCLSCR